MFSKITKQIIPLITFVVLGSPVANAEGVVDPLLRPALHSPLSSRSVLLGLTKTAERIVAVGERGIVIYSDDRGKSWNQSNVPVSVSLTDAAFSSAKIGWAIGHGGVVLKTEDGGESWQVQLDGARLMSQLEKRAGFSDAVIARWKKEGADKPFLALHVMSDQSVVVVGAYGLAFISRDSGVTWEYFGDKLDNPKSNHLYAMAVRDNQLFIAGEQGCLFVSSDGGESFKRIELPYKGTLFELHVSAKGLFAVGMKGKLLFSSNQGNLWKDVPNPIPVSLLSVSVLPDGKQLWLNQAGQFLLGAEDGQALLPLSSPTAPGTLRTLMLGDKVLITAGFRGVAAQPWNP